MKLFDDLYAGAMWDVGVAINRSNSLPLDKYAIFPSKALADAYASHNATAIRDQLIVEGLLDAATDKVADDLAKAKFNNNSYAGQIVAVVTESATTVYYIGADNLLHEVGAKIDVNEEIKVDGSTIKKDENGNLYADLEALGGLTEEDVLGLIAASKHASAMVVDSVNLETNKYTVNEVEYDAVANVIYYVKDAAAAGEDVYKEYLLIGEELTLIGSTSTDLSNYYTKSEVDDLIKDFITLEDVVIPELKLEGTNTVEAGDGEIVLLADLIQDAEDDHKLTRSYAAAATKQYVDDSIGKIEIPAIELENLEGEIETTEDTVKVVALQDLAVDGGHKITYQDVEVASKAGLNAVKDRVADLEGLKISETYATKAELKTHTDAADIEFAKLVGIGGTDEPATVVALVESLHIEDYLKSSDAETTYAKIGDSYTKTESDEKYALKTDIPEVPSIEIISDTTISDVKINIGTEEEPNEVDGLITVLRKVEAEGHTLTETRVALPTVAYIEDMIADVTGGESAGEVKAQLDAFKDTVASTYATKAELKVEADKLVGIGLVTEGEQGDQPKTVVEAISAAEARANAYTDEKVANATVKWDEMPTIEE